ncbi:MAG: phosphate regulon sensor histidine kinase PhoR [Gammaproteobacteria bacterium]|nr:phosphate regulon sensor histidine kinase PhoR [Gammaproteobacteria bacterium]
MSPSASIALTVVVVGLLAAGWFFGIVLWTTGAALVIVFVAYARGTRDRLAFLRWAQRPLRTPQDSLGRFQEAAKSLHDSLNLERTRNRRWLNLARRFRDTSDLIPDAWIVLDQEMNIEAVNRAATTLLGLKQSDVGRPISALVRHPEINRLLMNEDDLNIVEFASPTDDQTKLELRLIRISEDQNILLARDVTELNRLLSMRQDFIANVSHELRSPLTVLIGYIESIYGEDLDPDTLKEIVQRLDAPAQRMKSLVDDLLTLTRLEASPDPEWEDLSRIDCATLIQAISQEASSLKRDNHSISLDLERNLCVMGVGDELHSVFMNLFTNAIRYSPEGGPIDVRWYRLNENARFEITDSGLGIAPEHISRITERFYRVDPSNFRVKGGTGLGLAIVKHVLRRHQSALKVESKPGGGSTFFFDLPRFE